MVTALVILIIIVCAILVLLVLVQNSKGGGLASNIGGVGQAQQLFGARNTSDFVQKATWGTLATLVVLTFLINFAFIYARSQGTGQGSLRLGDQIQPGFNPSNSAIPEPAAEEVAPSDSSAQ
jgi:preprotein translocase subunit SecG